VQAPAVLLDPEMKPNANGATTTGGGFNRAKKDLEKLLLISTVSNVRA
jgi:hypothetical protein